MIKFTKYQGLGNDFIVIDAFEQKLPSALKLGDYELIRNICHRNFGLGADGLLVRSSEDRLSFGGEHTYAPGGDRHSGPGPVGSSGSRGRRTEDAFGALRRHEEAREPRSSGDLQSGGGPL